MTNGIVARIVDLFSSGTAQSLPGDLTAEQFCERSDKLKPRGYAQIVAQALRYYWGLAQDDTLWALRRAFPRSANYMTPVSVPIVEYVVKKQAAVFSGDPSFDLLDSDDQVVSNAGPVQWQEIVGAAELQRHLQQTNRITRLCKRSFVRATWNPGRRSVHLVTFTPDKVHIVFHPDSRDLNDAAGVLLDIEPAVIGGAIVRRWEFWSADTAEGGDGPRNFIIDERGHATGVPDEEGNMSFGNPCRDDFGRPIVPIISFADEDVSVGYWLLPRLSLIASQQAIDVDQTALKHAMRMQGFGQWVSETIPGVADGEDWQGAPTHGRNEPVESRAEGFLGVFQDRLQMAQDGDATVSMGPGVVITVPRGQKLTHVPQTAQIAEQVLANDRFLKQVLTAESVPPGELTGEPQRLSGFALQVERLSLTELRADQVALYKRPTEELMNLIRLVWDSHQPDNSTRFGPLRPRFRADAGSVLMDPATENATDAFELQAGLTTKARVMARRNGIGIAEAEAMLKEMEQAPVAAKPAPSEAAAGGGDSTEPDSTTQPPG